MTAWPSSVFFGLILDEYNIDLVQTIDYLFDELRLDGFVELTRHSDVVLEVLDVYGKTEGHVRIVE